MRKTVVAVLTLACIGHVASASAQTETTPAAPAASATPTAQPIEEKMICVDKDAGGNSRLGMRKVCHTQKEWDSLPRSRR